MSTSNNYNSPRMGAHNTPDSNDYEAAWLRNPDTGVANDMRVYSKRQI